MNKEYVQQYVQLEKEHWWFIARKKILHHYISKHVKGNNYRILNIGAAGGESSRLLGEFGKVVSVENDSYFVDYLQSQNIDVVDASILELPFDNNSFDMVCAFDVIEHVENDKAALAEMKRVCVPSGFVFVTVPAFQSLWSRHDVVNDHKRRYNENSLKSLVNKNDELDWIEIAYFNFILFLPVYVARKLSNLFSNRNPAKSDFETFKTGRFLNSVLKRIFSSELFLAKRMRLPWGVSLIGVLQKNKK